MPSKYLERNLAKYGEAIRLYVDDGGLACLNLRNFEDVLFDSAAKNPAIKEDILVGPRLNLDNSVPADIGSLLSVLDVIRFQRAVSASLRPDPRRGGTDVEAALKSGLQALGVTRANNVIQWGHGSPALTCRKTKKLIADELQTAKRLRSGWEQDAAREALGFVGWFPKPSLIAQEQRTLIFGSGKTRNKDNRDLKPVLSRLPAPSKNALDQLIDDLDEELKQDKSISQAELDRRLHSALDRVHAFAYRGDSRDPATVKAHGGLLPSFTRKAVGDFAKTPFRDGATKGNVSVLAKVFDEIRQSTKSRRKRRDNLAAYIEQLKAEKIFELTAYTGPGGEVFRGYLSTSKSTAIAKCFANLWATGEETGRSWCYAVRCNGGYEMKSHVKGVAVPDSDEMKKLHEASNFLEQEIAMPGGIWWDQVVGFRLVDYSDEGQFFAGPVFLREPGYWKAKQDEAAFDALFEQLSGAGQGDDATIRKSYKQVPPGDPWNLMANYVD